jgi:hypothetical protein
MQMDKQMQEWRKLNGSSWCNPCNGVGVTIRRSVLTEFVH